jgi:uncharacterized protein (DUF1330 family)
VSKGYWVTCYRSVSDPEALAKYAQVAGPLIQSKGGRIIARGNAVKAYEAGINQRLVVIEFDSVENAIAVYESPEYQAVLAILKDHVERDVRIIAGV